MPDPPTNPPLRCLGEARGAVLVAAALVCSLVVLLSASEAEARSAGSLDRLVHELDLGLNVVLGERRLSRADLALSLRSGAEATPELTHAVLELVLGKLSVRGFRRMAPIEAGADARQRRRIGRRQGFELLLDLELVVMDGHLHLRGMLVRIERHLWKNTLQLQQGAESHLHARVRLDAEIRGYLASVASPVLRFAPRNYPMAEVKQALALGSGDLDGDGRAELILLLPRQVQLLTFKDAAAGFVASSSVELTGPWAPVQPRRPLGALLVSDRNGDRRAEFFARSSEMSRAGQWVLHGELLRRERELVGYPLALLPTGAGAKPLLCLALEGRDTFDPACLPTTHVGQPFKAPFYALRTASITRAKAPSHHFLGLVDHAGRLHLQADNTWLSLAGLSAVGLAFDLLDLDDDGGLELVTTEAGGPQDPDRITVYRLVDGVLRRLWRSSELPGPVTALTHGDIDGDGQLELIAAVEQGAGQVITLMVLN